MLEVGAGPGFLSAHARERRKDLRCTASDLHPLPWNSVAADAGRLPLADGSVGAVVGLDVLHHFGRPSGFFREAARVLGADGRIVLVEPWITPLSWVIYRFFHQEDCRLSRRPVEPVPGREGQLRRATPPCRGRWSARRPESRWRELGLSPPRVRRLNAFAYVLSLGFRPGSLLPRALASPAMALDRATSPLAPLTALRAVLTWRRL